MLNLGDFWVRSGLLFLSNSIFCLSSSTPCLGVEALTRSAEGLARQPLGRHGHLTLLPALDELQELVVHGVVGCSQPWHVDAQDVELGDQELQLFPQPLQRGSTRCQGVVFSWSFRRSSSSEAMEEMRSSTMVPTNNTDSEPRF